jgi:hypothetical protein
MVRTCVPFVVFAPLLILAWLGLERLKTVLFCLDAVHSTNKRRVHEAVPIMTEE